MLATAGVQRYQSVRVTTSTPGELLLMLYDGLFRFLGEASSALKSGNRALAGTRVDKAHAILTELTAGLNPKYAPQLCANLEAVYGFCMTHLVEANIHQDPRRIENVLRVLAPLREAWITVVRSPEAQAQAQAHAAEAGR